jgi:hypothetical protein
MRFLRNRFTSKFLAVLFLLLIIESTIHATISYALTTGPHQPEYTSYEEPGATDMVNLLTGDFSFSLPILDVPGPEGGFSVPLTYNAGIGTEQEASWMGLGWTLNVGAITRNIVQFPDDANGEVQSVTKKDLDGVRGWTSSALGLGQIGWNTAQGHYGSLSLLGIVNYQYDKNGGKGGLIGVNVGSDGVSFDGVQFASAAITIATWGTGSGAVTAGKIAVQAAVSIGVGAALSFVTSSQAPNAPTDGYWQYSKHEEQEFLHKNYWIWLDQTRNEEMFGVLNLDKINKKSPPLSDISSVQINGGSVQPLLITANLSGTNSASDASYFLPPNVEYKNANCAIALATDNYSVKAPSISGAMRPYRLDIGSVTLPQRISDIHIGYEPLPYQSYKVPFVYEGSNSNGYFHHVGSVPGSIAVKPEFYFGISSSISASTMGSYNIITHKFDDNIFQNRVRPDLSGVNKIPMANHIEWLSNEEIGNAPNGFPSGFIDYFSGSDRFDFRNSYDYPAPKAIGGYSITGLNGITYHFALPSYEYANYTKIADKNNPSTKYSEIKRSQPFANTWLLTGITGSDFVDRGGINNAPNGVIDENDWGYWVKFNYGKYAENYQWRIPYLENTSTRDASDNYNSFSLGMKQLYYLNSIETRSHVALFIKDNRSDNRSANSIESLRLSEIDLLKKEDYQKLFLATNQGGYGVPTDKGLANLGKYYLMSDFFSATGADHPAQGNFIIQNALKRVKFTHTYDLCQGTDNSLATAASNKGKLTLTRVALLGRNENKIVPDYKFEYGSNKGYNKDNWDGWGMYNSNGTNAHNTHSASDNETDGAVWSLTKITNPLGSSIQVNYERDTYSSISGEKVYDFFPYNNGASTDYFSGSNSLTTLTVSNPSQFQVGDVLKVTGTTSYSCSGSSYPSSPYSGEFTVQSVGTSSINLGTNFRNITGCPSGIVSFTSDYGTVQRQKSKKGGNVRVALLSLTDEGGKEYRTKYLYKNDNGLSSGVVAQEPEYVRAAQDYAFYNLPNYPFTPVMYSKVTVLTGKLIVDTDYHTKQVYEFETPHSNMVINTGISDANYADLGGLLHLKNVKNEISDFTSSIGRLKSVKLYSQSNTLVSSSDMIYTNSTNPIVNRNLTTNLIENNYQGLYSEGVLLLDRTINAGSYFQHSRTTILKHPSQLQKVINSKDGFTSETENKVWDFISGLVLEKTDKSPLGLRTRTVTKPAFRVSEYSQMGSKALDPNNKNMLGHEASSYTYQIDASGNNIGLLSASVQTWKSDWSNYRYLNRSTYADGADGSPNVWRKHQNYIYKGTYSDLRADGSLNFSTAKEFKFTPPGFGVDPDTYNAGWQKTGEVTRYDHYSAALEGRDLNNIFSSSKMDISAKQVYANASNANYHELAYTGAEDWDASGTGLYLGGEVAKGAGTKVTKTPTGTETHTGQYAAQVGAGAKTFIYKPASLTNNRVYRVSAWTNSPAGAVYYSLNGGAEQTILPISTMKVGNWYQINVEIPVSTFSSLEVGVKSTSGTVSFDDFRFQPRDGALTANVYDPVTSAITFVLDNQNMFTQYEYNDRGQLIKTYNESFLYGVKLVSENKTNYRRFNTNQ